VGKSYFVYIMSNVAKMLYLGVTNDLKFRVFQHKTKQTQGYTKAYNLFKLVYFEICGDIRAAILREKQIKGWLRAKKTELIEWKNPDWNDLAQELVQQTFDHVVSIRQAHVISSCVKQEAVILSASDEDARRTSIDQLRPC
jgi:putative endonuclease